MTNGEAPDGSAPTRVIGPDDVPVIDLLSDPLLRTLPRTEFQGQQVPTLGGIPLLEKLGQGGMGAVYRGLRVMLRQEVAVKVLPMQLAAHQEGLKDRFVREAQIAARIESPHLVRVTDVNEIEGFFYLVMEYVRGITAARLLKQDRIEEATALDVCIAATRGLAAAHLQGIIHRDIKPDNILIPRASDGSLHFDLAKVADLGLARSEHGDHALTASSIGMGTPGYMAPEQAMSARHAGKASDVFGMGATLYALLSGHAPFTGDSTAAIIIATVQQPHPPIRESRPDVSDATARLLDQCLSKDPADRFADATVLLEALQACRGVLSNSGMRTAALEALTSLQHRPEAGPPVRNVTPLPATATTVVVAKPASGKRTLAIAAAALIAVAIAALVMFNRSRSVAPVATFGVAAGPEQAEWLQWAAAEFAKTEAGKGASVRILPMSDGDAQSALVGGNQGVNAWVPMSGETRSVFEQRWKSAYGTAPIARAEVLGVTPHAFVMVKSRFDEFAKKYTELNFTTIRAALLEPGGWGTIAGRPEWGRFSFALTRPSTYSGGLTALTLIAFDFHRKAEALTSADVTAPAFGEWARGFERAFAVEESPAQAIRALVLKGPSKFDGMMTYESSILSELDDIEDRWGPVQIVYPRLNMWSESTYYVLHTPWNDEAERKMANDFADFLLSEPAQKQMVMFGFRPSNPRVRTHFDGSPFSRYANRGIQREIGMTADAPPREVVAALLKERTTR